MLCQVTQRRGENHKSMNEGIILLSLATHIDFRPTFFQEEPGLYPREKSQGPDIIAVTWKIWHAGKSHFLPLCVNHIIRLWRCGLTFSAYVHSTRHFPTIASPLCGCHIFKKSYPYDSLRTKHCTELATYMIGPMQLTFQVK